MPIRNRANIAEWFCKRSENHGFKVKKESLVVDSVHADIFSKKGHKVTICKAKITGELEVTDLSKFRQAVFKGIGREKSFGCGLLLVIPKVEF